jgi:hypothetical protein
MVEELEKVAPDMAKDIMKNAIVKSSIIDTYIRTIVHAYNGYISQ